MYLQQRTQFVHSPGRISSPFTSEKTMRNADRCRHREYTSNTFIKIVFPLLALLSVLLMSSSAFAQCKTDVECKGDRICVAGECVSPQPAPSPAVSASETPQAAPDPYQYHQPPPPPPPPSAYGNPYQLREPQVVYRRPLSRGWAIPGGALGIVFSGVALGLGIKSEIENEAGNGGSSMAFGAAATGILAVWTPVVFAAGKSARRSGDPRVRGVAGLRVTGWVTYGLTLASAVVMLAMGLADVEVPDGYILVSTISGVASVLFMSIDAFVSGAQASRAIRQDAAAAQRAELNAKPQKQFQWAVTAAPLMNTSGNHSGAAVGVVGLF